MNFNQIKYGRNKIYYYSSSPMAPIVAAYQERVLDDGGNIDETQANLVNLLNQLNGVVPDFTNSCKLFVAPHLGNKQASGTGATAGNRAANKIYNIMGASGDLVQATAASQPLLLRNTGVNFAYLSGVNGNFFSTPNAVANQITGDIGIIANLAFGSISSNMCICSKRVAGNVGYIFTINSSNQLTFVFSQNGTTEITATSSVVQPFSLNSFGWVAVTRQSSTGNVIFYTSTDGSNWTQLGATQSTSSGAIFNSTITFNIGSRNPTGTLEPFNGLINSIRLLNSINLSATPNQIFNPQLYNRSVSQTTIPSSTGETYTINIDSATTGLKAMIPDKGLVVGNGTSYGMQAPTFNLTGSAFTRYTIFQKYSNTAGFQIINELGANIASSQGLYLAINGSASNEEFGVNAGGLNNSRYTSNSLLMKVATSVVNINNADEATPYLINNSAQSLVAKDSSFNNTSPLNATGLNLLARNNAASLWANAVIFADLIFKGEHDATTRTNVYNILKTYFNL